MEGLTSGPGARISVGSTLCRLSCRSVSHPESASCAAAALRIWWRSWLACLRLYTFVYLGGLLVQKRRVDARALVAIARAVELSSRSFATQIAVWSIGHCVLRKGLGRFTDWSGCLVPAYIGLHVAIIDKASKYDMLLSTVANSFVHWRAALLLERHPRLRSSPRAAAAALFMALSAAFGAVACRPDCRPHLRHNGFWLFFPPMPVEDVDAGEKRIAKCPHEETSCSTAALKSGARLLALGVALRAVRLLELVHRPRALWRRLARRSTFDVGIFFGAYAAIYTASSCVLRRLVGSKGPVHGAAAGGLAGSAILLYPDLGIASALFTTLLQVGAGRAAAEAGVRVPPPAKVALYALLTAGLVDAFITRPSAVPRPFHKYLADASGGIAVTVRTSVMKHAHLSRLPAQLSGL